MRMERPDDTVLTIASGFLYFSILAEEFVFDRRNISAGFEDPVAAGDFFFEVVIACSFDVFLKDVRTRLTDCGFKTGSSFIQASRPKNTHSMSACANMPPDSEPMFPDAPRTPTFLIVREDFAIFTSLFIAITRLRLRRTRVITWICSRLSGAWKQSDKQKAPSKMPIFVDAVNPPW
ncbi:MAG: hypothetical protein U1F27_13605 [Turneriella sp.]